MGDSGRVICTLEAEDGGDDNSDGLLGALSDGLLTVGGEDV